MAPKFLFLFLYINVQMIAVSRVTSAGRQGWPVIRVIIRMKKKEHETKGSLEPALTCSFRAMDTTSWSGGLYL